MLFFNKFFTTANFSKILVIFTVGLLSRYFINEYFNINVFTEYWSMVSVTFYSLFATFVVFIHECFTFFNVNIIPNFIINILNYIFIEPFIYIYSRTWGKYPEVFQIKSSRSSNIGEFTQNDSYSNNLYPEGTQVSRYPSMPSTYEGYEVNSFYARIAQGNPYDSLPVSSERSTANYGESSRAARAQNMPMAEFRDYVEEESKQIMYDYSNREYPAENNNSDNRFFIVDSINQDGRDRSLITPSPYTIDPSQLLRAPQLSNLDTPSTMTPLFGSEEQLSLKPSQSSIAYTNDTNHASVGFNESPLECSEPVNVNLKRVRGKIEPRRGGQFTKERSIAQARIRERIREQFQDAVSQPTFKNKDVILYDNPIEGKARLVAKINNFSDKVEALTIKYHDIAKRKFYWKIWERGTGNYSTYEEFKMNFDPQTKIWREIAKTTKSDISSKVRSLMQTNPFGTRGQSIEVRNIRRLSPSSTEAGINNLHSTRNRARPLPAIRR